MKRFVVVAAALGLSAVSLKARAQPLPDPQPQPLPAPTYQEPLVPPPTAPVMPPAAPIAPAEPPQEPPKEVKPEGGYFPKDGFTLRSSDENWRLRLRLQSFIRAHIRANGKAEFANPFMTLRPIIEGQLYKKWIRFWTSMELAANPVYLLDSYVEIQPVPGFGLRIGQQWTPFSRHEGINGPAQLLFPEWNPVADYFWTGRDKGITAFGATADGVFDYMVGAFVGSPLRSFQPFRGNYQVIGRIGLNPLGPVGSELAYAEGDEPAKFGYSIGLNAASSKIDPGAENFNPSTFKFDVAPTGVTKVQHIVALDFQIQSSSVMSLTEFYVRRTDPHGTGPDYTSVGGFTQLGVMVYKRDVDIVARGTWADVNMDAARDTAFAVEGGSNYYIHAPNVILKFRYGYGSQQTPVDAATGTSGGAPLLVSPGPVHVLTAQINTVF